MHSVLLLYRAVEQVDSRRVQAVFLACTSMEGG
jgi:hypothetical protein